MKNIDMLKGDVRFLIEDIKKMLNAETLSFEDFEVIDAIWNAVSKLFKLIDLQFSCSELLDFQL